MPPLWRETWHINAALFWYISNISMISELLRIIIAESIIYCVEADVEMSAYP